MILARFIIGLLFILGSIPCFMHDPQTTGWIIGGCVLVLIGLVFWGLGEAFGDIADAIDD